MALQASLDGPFAKLRRAKEHLEAFEVKADGVLEFVEETTTFVASCDPDTSRFFVEVRDEPAIPFHISTIAGDVVHNLRSSLDLLAYQLPILASGSAWEDTEWPIVTQERDLRRWRFKGLRKRLVAAGRYDLWAKVVAHQSIGYEQKPRLGMDMLTARYYDLPLLVLNELAQRDKHRLLIDPWVNIKEFSRLEPRCIRDCERPRIIEGAGWFTLKKNAPPIAQFTVDITGPNPEMEVDVGFTPQPVSLGFLPGPASEWLEFISAAVYAVIEDFAPHF